MLLSNERIALYATVLLVVIAGAVFAYTATRDDDPVASDASGNVEVLGESAEPEATGEEADGSPTTTAPGATSTTAPEATTTTATEAPADDAEAEGAGLGLSQADMSAPPEEPVGIYREGQVILGGSVPSEEVAARYLERSAAIFGPENVIMHMAIDPRVSGQEMRIDVDEQFQFETGSTDFDQRFTSLLDLGAVALQLIPESTLVITGHTDAIGDEATNQALSRARAQVVVDWMIERGVPPNRIEARGAGESEPVATNETPEGRRANRRVEASVEGITPR